MNNKAMNRCLLMLCCLVASICIYCAAASEYCNAAAKVEVFSAEDMNNALGGDHVVEDDTVILQHDVELDNTYLVVKKGKEIVLDTNKKKVIFNVSNDNEFGIAFCVYGGSMKLTGNGYVQVNDEKGDPGYSIVFSLTHGGKLTIDSSTVIPGVFGYAIVNEESGEDFSSPMQCSLKINGGRIKGMIYDYPYASGIYEINGGFIEEFNVKYSDKPVSIYGGAIQKMDSGYVNITGGIIGNARLNERYDHVSVIKGGTIKHGLEICGYGCTKLLGGTIEDGVRINGSSTLRYQKSPRLILDGSKIIYDSESGFGIQIFDGATKLKLISGMIYSSESGTRFGSGARAAVYVEKKEYGDDDESKVYFQAVKGRKLVIKGFGSALFRETKKTKVVIKPHTRLTAKKYDAKKKDFTNKSVRYVKGSKIPRFIRGNMTVSYK